MLLNRQAKVMRRKINIGAAIYPSQSQPVMSDTAMPAMQYIASAYTRYTTATKPPLKAVNNSFNFSIYFSAFESAPGTLKRYIRKIY